MHTLYIYIYIYMYRYSYSYRYMYMYPNSELAVGLPGAPAGADDAPPGEMII